MYMMIENINTNIILCICFMRELLKMHYKGPVDCVSIMAKIFSTNTTSNTLTLMKEVIVFVNKNRQCIYDIYDFALNITIMHYILTIMHYILTNLRCIEIKALCTDQQYTWV